MAGKSNRGRHRKGSQSATNSLDSDVSSDAPMKDNTTTLGSAKVEENGAPPTAELTAVQAETSESETPANSVNESKQGEF